MWAGLKPLLPFEKTEHHPPFRRFITDGGRLLSTEYPVARLSLVESGLPLCAYETNFHLLDA